jgi:DNA-binding phage protein
MKVFNAVPPASSYKLGLYARLRSSTYAAEYLHAAMEDDSPTVKLLALHKVITARDPAKVLEDCGDSHARVSNSAAPNDASLR